MSGHKTISVVRTPPASIRSLELLPPEGEAFQYRNKNVNDLTSAALQPAHRRYSRMKTCLNSGGEKTKPVLFGYPQDSPSWSRRS